MDAMLTQSAHSRLIIARSPGAGNMAMLTPCCHDSGPLRLFIARWQHGNTKNRLPSLWRFALQIWQAVKNPCCHVARGHKAAEKPPFASTWSVNMAMLPAFFSPSNAPKQAAKPLSASTWPPCCRPRRWASLAALVEVVEVVDVGPPHLSAPREVVQSPHAPPPWRCKKVSFIARAARPASRRPRGSRLQRVQPWSWPRPPGTLEQPSLFARAAPGAK
jgi:hypothetical protein